LTDRREFTSPEIAKPVVVAEVPVAVWKVKFWRVVELLTKNPPVPTSSWAIGLFLPIPTKPLEVIETADIEEVANEDGEEVAR